MNLRQAPPCCRAPTLSVIFFLVCASPLDAHGTDNASTIISDQPGISLSAFSIPKGQIQTEMRFGFYSAGIGNQLILPDLLLRFGICRNLELRLAPPSLFIHSRDGINGPRRNRGESGILPVADWSYRRPLSFRMSMTDLKLGTKGIWQITDQLLWGFAVELALPVSNLEIESWIATTLVHGILGWRINKYTTLEGNLSFRLFGPSDYGERWTRTYGASARLRGFFGDGFQYYLELYSLFWEKNRPYPVLNFGFDARVAREFTLGVFLGSGLLNMQRWTDIFVGISVAIRL